MSLELLLSFSLSLPRPRHHCNYVWLLFGMTTCFLLWKEAGDCSEQLCSGGAFSCSSQPLRVVTGLLEWLPAFFKWKSGWPLQATHGCITERMGWVGGSTALPFVLHGSTCACWPSLSGILEWVRMCRILRVASPQSLGQLAKGPSVVPGRTRRARLHNVPSKVHFCLLRW